VLAARIDDLSRGLNEPPDDLRRLFAVPPREVRLEIGFGAGEHLIHAAAAEPDVGFIGAEPFLNGLAAAIAGIEARGLANVRVWREDVRPLLDALPPASLARVYLYYPDPWRKRRHWKRRFLGPDNIARLARVIRPGGTLRFATDWSNYASWGVAQVRRDPNFRFTAAAASDWTTPWPDFLRTRYETKAIREGRVPSYLEFERL
jgi:tRNA (guanine-N7-)-methyltransferase